jgi:hypothetical protein
MRPDISLHTRSSDVRSHARTHAPIPLDPVDQIIRPTVPDAFVHALGDGTFLILVCDTIRDETFADGVDRVDGKLSRGDVGGYATVQRGRRTPGGDVERLVSRKLSTQAMSKFNISSPNASKDLNGNIPLDPERSRCPQTKISQNQSLSLR